MSFPESQAMARYGAAPTSWALSGATGGFQVGLGPVPTHSKAGPQESMSRQGSVASTSREPIHPAPSHGVDVLMVMAGSALLTCPERPLQGHLAPMTGMGGQPLLPLAPLAPGELPLTC